MLYRENPTSLRRTRRCLTILYYIMYDIFCFGCMNANYYDKSLLYIIIIIIYTYDGTLLLLVPIYYFVLIYYTYHCHIHYIYIYMDCSDVLYIIIKSPYTDIL